MRVRELVRRLNRFHFSDVDHVGDWLLDWVGDRVLHRRSSRTSDRTFHQACTWGGPDPEAQTHATPSAITGYAVSRQRVERGVPMPVLLGGPHEPLDLSLGQIFAAASTNCLVRGVTACQKTAEIEARAGTAFSGSPVRQKMAGRDRPHRPHCPRKR